MNPDYALFAQVVEAGSLSAAARALAISPAMVSKRLARLEARLGVRLVHRTTRRLSLTDAGEAFHADLAVILQSLREAEHRVMGTSAHPAGRLRVSAPTSFGRLHLTPHLHAFLAAHPRITVELDLSDAYVDLIAQRIDVAIRIAADVPTSLAAHRLGRNRRILCASPRYLTQSGTPATPAALPAHRLLAADGQWPWRLVGPDGQRRAVDGISHVRTNSSEVVRELALTGVGIALRSLWDVGEALSNGTLVRVLPDWEGPDDLAIWAVHPRAAAIPPAVTAFVAFLTETIDPEAWEQP
ncbi:MAG: LysR family transcriptional regulator [Sphingomonas adhaesiva]|uniref:LysR family transcriptional regulator n=1 Tax=Sphingomonas adhaesiva TaxID=28212 RepID=UPI002FF544DD